MIPLDLVQYYLNDNQEGMKNLLTCFLNLVMQMEAHQQAGADPYERTDKRKTQRNGYKNRSLKTRYGEISLKKPQFRDFPFETELFGKYSRVEKALVNAISESYLQGVSTRKIQDIVSHFGLEQLSPSSVSRISKELDDSVQKFLNRTIESKYPYIFVDASYFKVRDGVRYVNKALLVTAGVREDGHREILGARIADCENEEFWSGLFYEMKERGLDGVKMVISDGHKGIQKAVETVFTGASWQMCHVHFIRAVLRNVPKKEQKEISELLKEAFDSEEKLQNVADFLNQKGNRKAANTIERFIPDVLNYRSFQKSHWKRIKTTNMMERLNKELKRRSKVVGAFPNEDSLLRLVVSIMIDINEEWITGKKYLSMENE